MHSSFKEHIDQLLLYLSQYTTTLYPHPLVAVNILRSHKCALILNVPKLIWFKIDLMMAESKHDVILVI